MVTNIRSARRTISDRGAIATARAVIGLFAVVCLLGAIAPANAASDELFTIEGISVDQSAKTTAEARELALTSGYIGAFRRLSERLVPYDRLGLVPKLELPALTALVRDFEVSGEKSSDVRYLATLRMRFDRRAVRRVLREAGVPYAETESKPMLVLPLMSRAGVLLLWDRPNTWLKAWKGLPPRQGLVPMTVPRGGLQDLSVISAAQAARGDKGRLRDIARRYRTAGVLVVTARPSRRMVAVTVRRSDDAQNRMWETKIRRRGEETSDALMRRAASETAAFIQEQWKNENLLRFDQQNQLSVVVPLEELSQWVAVRRRIEDIAFISETQLIGISRNEARMLVSYVGAADQLKTAMAQKDMRLAQENDSWFLYYKPRGTGRPRPRAQTR